MSDIVKHYMWKDGETDNSPSGTADLESRFPGVRYSKCTGLGTKGKRKNVHIESYADSPELRVWQDSGSVIREATEVVLTLLFTGDSRQLTYDNFVEYISNGKIHYWDTIRKREAFMIFTDKADPKEDTYKGSIPYILVEFKFQNLRGECPIREISEF